MRLILATENRHKLEEFRGRLPGVEVIPWSEVRGARELPPEDGSSYRENAFIKAQFVFQATGIPSLADDSGFEVLSLNSEPGVYSARYLNSADSSLQCGDILRRLVGSKDRSARFVCSLCLVRSRPSDATYFDGVVEGRVPLVASGSAGFGYDPIFIPEGYSKTFAEMTLEEKSRISHRARALELMHRDLLL